MIVTFGDDNRRIRFASLSDRAAQLRENHLFFFQMSGLSLEKREKPVFKKFHVRFPEPFFSYNLKVSFPDIFESIGIFQTLADRVGENSGRIDRNEKTVFSVLYPFPVCRHVGDYR